MDKMSIKQSENVIDFMNTICDSGHMYCYATGTSSDTDKCAICKGMISHKMQVRSGDMNIVQNYFNIFVILQPRCSSMRHPL